MMDYNLKEEKVLLQEYSLGNPCPYSIVYSEISTMDSACPNLCLSALHHL